MDNGYAIEDFGFTTAILELDSRLALICREFRRLGGPAARLLQAIRAKGSSRADMLIPAFITYWLSHRLII